MAYEMLDIKDYILENIVPTCMSSCNYSADFVDDANGLKVPNKHAQLRCPHLIWPFCKIGTCPTEVPIKAAQILVEADDKTNVKTIMELTLEMRFAEDYHQPGDTIAILPFNDDKTVEDILRRMKLTRKAMSVFQLRISSNCVKKNLKVPPYIPTLFTPFELLRDCLNVRAVPKKQFLSALANCCTNADERAFLSCLSSKEGCEYYSQLILNRGLTFRDLLSLCPSCKPTLELLIEHLPRLLPRPYSIANSPLVNEIKIIFSILSKKPGLTTEMLKTLASPFLSTVDHFELPKIIVYGRQTNRFRLTSPEAIENNHILISVGTGISPFLGFFEKKTQLFEDSDKSLGNTWLFAGAATEKSLPHRDRILAYEKSNVIQRYFECLSRISDASFRYVHKQILSLKSEFVEFLMQKNTLLYVCADGGSISRDIEKGIAGCIAQVQGISSEEALQVIRAYKENGKYREDVWL